MKHYSREFVLGDLTEAEFQNWKHHPVTKVVRRYLQDLERYHCEQEIAELRNSHGSRDQHKLGEFKGYVNAIQHLYGIEHQTIFDFYPPDAETEEQT